MKFLTVLIIIFFYRNWIGDNPVRQAIPFDRYTDWFRGSMSAPIARFVLCVAVPVLVVGFAAEAIDDWAFGLPWLLLAIIVMLASIEVVDADALFDSHAQTLQALNEEASLEDAIDRQEDFKETAIYEVFQSLYPALFWFLLVGPAGALAYALSREYLADLGEDDAELDLVERFVYWLEWPAAKVNGFLFALVGHFGKCFDEWADTLFVTGTPISQTLAKAACAASGSGESQASMAEFVRTSLEHNFDLKDLLTRISYGWLGLAAVIAIFGL